MVYTYFKNERRQNHKDNFNRKQNKNVQDQNGDKSGKTRKEMEEEGGGSGKTKMGGKALLPVDAHKMLDEEEENRQIYR
jgi:hypothetical protein